MNDVKVVEGNIPCTNGIIHLVAAPFTAQSPVQAPGSDSSSFNIAIVVVPIVTVVVIVIVVAIGVFMYKKAHSGYWNLLQAWISRRKVNLVFVFLT